MSQRTPVSEHFDATVGMSTDEDIGPYAYTLVKHNIGWATGQLRYLEAEPLEGDFREKDRDPRIPPHTDFWPFKQKVDVIVCGHAFPPGGKPLERFRASLRIGERIKELDVYGPRLLRFIHGTPKISMPEPTAAVPLGREAAYGGTDAWVSVDAEPGSEAEIALNFDHPGLYPRNEAGKGYLVIPDAEREVEMPSLEDPRDPLTESRVVADGPHLWHQQPLPWFLGRSSMLDFPRLAYVALDPWFLGPEDEAMPEVRRGELPRGYRALMDTHLETHDHDIRFRQEASYDMTFSSIAAGTPFELRHVHPDKPVTGFRFPSHVPRVDFVIDGEIVRAPPRLHHVVCHPEEERFTVVYGALTELSRTFLPAFQKDIALGARIDGQVYVPYEAPEIPGTPPTNPASQ